MQVNITARHLDLTPPLANYVQKKVEKCEKYLDHLVWAQVILSVEKYRQVAEIVIHAAKITFRSKEESIDLYAAIDLAVDKMEKQLKKHKEITKVHRQARKGVPAEKSVGTIRGKSLPAKEAETGKYLISEVKRFDVRPSTIREAIDEMELLGYSFYMFMNAETSQVNVVYRRENGSYGLIEPQI